MSFAAVRVGLGSSFRRGIPAQLQIGSSNTTSLRCSHRHQQLALNRMPYDPWSSRGALLARGRNFLINPML